ncbi:helix-turn-helix transcriptional regulator [Microbacterium sulfonylureivorans]|uniref:helix-turn-helix transcriptional regulator n=1 Tax=Microbacterium sulfonylureivorans TaxID=2486854 RepID=UPI000FDB8FB8|nr:hypothetical protein [Microbacterium sulfonylureivorans]
MTSTEHRAGAEVDQYLSPAQVASLLPGLTENALAIRRHRHKEPAFCRFGRTVVYPLADLQAWIAASTVKAQKHG